jgi:hypothetical protein
MNLSTRKLTSILMIAGPIGVFTIWGILSDAIVGSSEVNGVGNAGLFLQNASSAGSIAGFLELFGLLFFLAQIIGLVLFARQLSAEGSAGAAFANLSALLGIALMALVATSSDLGLSALSLGDKGLTAEAMALAQISIGSGASFGIFFALANGLVTIPMIGQASTSTKKYLGFAFALLMILLLITELFGISLGDIVEIIIWLGSSLIFVAAGVLNFKE